MESSTEIRTGEQEMLVKWPEPNWEKMMYGQSQDLDSSARSLGALVRQRKLKGAMNLLRLVMAYAVCDWSLRLVGAWATIQEIACLSDVALLYRFCQCGAWLGHVIGQILRQRIELLDQLGGVRLRLVDATVISRPGSRGTDWRVHLSFDVGRLSLDGIEISDAQGGESLARFAPRADEIYVADRGYAARRGLGTLLASDARLVIRINWQNLPLQTEPGHPLALIPWLRELTGATERPVLISTPQGTFPLRLIACPLPADKAALARAKVAHQAKKKGRKLSYATWFAAGFILLVTNLPTSTWEINRVLWIYRVRWQIELYIKRLKSLLHLDHLRAQDPRLVQTYLLAKLLAALLLDQLVQQAEQQAPHLFQSLQRPVSVWRLTDLFLVPLHQWIVGPISIANVLRNLPRLQRYLCDPPRRRPQQLAWARRFLARLTGI